MVGNEEPRSLLTPRGFQRVKDARQDRETNAVIKPQGTEKDVKAPSSNIPSVRKHTEVTKGQTS